jgi:hypothetical protein
MEPLKRLIGGLVVVSAAILAVLVAGHPAVAAPTLAASALDGGPSGTSTGTRDGLLISTSDGTSTSTSCCSSDGTSTGTSDSRWWTSTSDGTSTSTSTSCCTSGGTSSGTSDGTSDCVDPCVASSPSLQLSKSQAAPGETITATGDGYAKCTDVDSQVTSVQLLGDGKPIADVTGLAGSFSAQITVPPDTPQGNHTVAAECEGTSVILASSDLTVTGPGGGGGSSSGQGGGSSSGQGGGSSSGQGGGSSSGQGGGSSSGQGGGSSSGQGGGSSGQSSRGKGVPIALISGTGGGLALAILFVLWALTSHAGKGRHDVRWAKEHLRAVAGSSLDPPSAQIRPRPGARSVSLGLEPHDDHLGNQKIEEVAR